MRYTIKKAGGFNVKIDKEEMKMFIMPDEHEWYIPPGSKFKFRLKKNVYTEIIKVIFSDGLSSLMPNGYEEKQHLDSDEMEALHGDTKRKVINKKTKR